MTSEVYLDLRYYCRFLAAVLGTSPDPSHLRASASLAKEISYMRDHAHMRPSAGGSLTGVTKWLWEEVSRFTLLDLEHPLFTSTCS